MRIERTLTKRPDRMQVSVPAAVRDHLGLVPGGRLYWHVVRRGVVAVTASGHVVAGRRMTSADCSQCAAYRAEVLKLRQQLQTSMLPSLHEVTNAAVMQATRLTIPLGGRLAAVEELLREVLVRLGFPPRRHHAPRLRSPRAPRGAEVVPAPLLSSPPPFEVEVERGADTSGQPAPGVPLEAEACSERDGAV